MPRTVQVYGNFSAGELSPLMRGRTDFVRYQHGAARIENALVLLQGGVQKRPGTRYVATAKRPDLPVRLEAFVFRSADALVLEFGHEYLRFYKNDAQIQVAGTPIEVATPYAVADLFALRLNQKNDVVYITHPRYAPRKLQRESDVSWPLSTITPNPPPTTEAGIQPAVRVTLSATVGTVTCTASEAFWVASDLQRELHAGVGRGVLTGITDATVATLQILDGFSTTSLAAGAWTLDGSPVAQLKPSDVGPAGALITLALRQVQPGAPDLVTNGTFGSGLTGWSNYSGGVVASGTHTGAANSAVLIDSAAAFTTAGVLPTQLLVNSTDGSSGQVAGVAPTQITLVLAGGTDNDFDTGDAYSITQTGSASALSGGCTLFGGTAGIAWIEQALATVAGQTYRVTFDVSGNPVSVQVGSTSRGADLLAELSYPVGGQRALVFTATGATSYLQVRNNQNAQASVNNIAARLYGAGGWRTSDVGKYVYVHGGLVRLIGYVSPELVTAQVLDPLSTADEAAAGAWTLEQESWNATDLYPALSRFHEQRLLFASSPGFPQTVWGSVSGDFENFTRGSLADKAFEYTLAEAEGLLYWMLPSEQLMLGAENGPFRMVGDGDGPIVASSPPLVRRIVDQGTGPVEALRVGLSVLFVQRQGSKLRELTFQQASYTFEARDLSSLSGHLLTTRRVTELLYAPEPLPLLWAVGSDGVLLGVTYDRPEQVLAWHQHTTQGIVESAAVIPHPTANAYQTWLAVQRTIGGQVTRFIEVLDDAIVGVDAAVRTDEPTLAMLGGLAHLEGAQVRAAFVPATGTHWATTPLQTVTGGEISLPVASTRAYAGLPYRMVLETLPPEIPGAPSIQLQKKRWDRLFVRLYATGIGLAINGQPLPFRRTAQAMDDGVPFLTGDIQLPHLGWSLDGTLTLTHDEPLPCTVLMLGGDVSIGDQ